MVRQFSSKYTWTEKFGHIEIAQLQLAFSERLKLNNIELVDLKNASAVLLKQIAQKSVLLYENEKFAYAKFKIYALKRFMEAGRLLKLREHSLNHFIKSHAR